MGFRQAKLCKIRDFYFYINTGSSQVDESYDTCSKRGDGHHSKWNVPQVSELLMKTCRTYFLILKMYKMIPKVQSIHEHT